MTAPSWRDVLPAPPPGGRLQEAWLTSFNRPDAGLLVEHLLPSLLGASRSLSEDARERAFFFGELCTELKALQGRLTVISSAPREETQSSQYPWLWSYVSHFMVGANSHAVQHAKLWAFHWKLGNEELIELHISSTNLTLPAFKAQLQAGWTVSLPLGARTSVGARRSWGALVPFLDALGASAGVEAKTRIQRLVMLLSRTECPSDIKFIASVPGGQSAARQLRHFNVSEIHVLAPTIGEWNERTLLAWSSEIGVTPSKVHLKWISTKHPWAGPGWTLSSNACATLQTSGVQVECLPNELRFTTQHRGAESRWSHAKLYLLRSGRRRRLLVTSANWSASAWGAGRTSPRNFELGVVFDSEWTNLEKIGEPFGPADTVHCDPRAEDEERMSSLAWAEATWDGKRIRVRARSTDFSKAIRVTVSFSGGLKNARLALVGGKATTLWRDPKHAPFAARFTQGSAKLVVDVIDLRPAAEFNTTPLPEVDPQLEQALRDAFLLQRYGGPAVELDTVDLREQGDSGARPPPQDKVAPADYSVQAWTYARSAFNVVDRWRAALAEAARDPALHERVRLDGMELRDLYKRRADTLEAKKGHVVPAALVAEEIGWHLINKA